MNADPPTWPCPVCGTPTLGWHIAGSVYDFTCDTCARETDASFRRFVRHVVDEVTAENRTEEGTTP